MAERQKKPPVFSTVRNVTNFLHLKRDVSYTFAYELV